MTVRISPPKPSLRIPAKTTLDGKHASETAKLLDNVWPELMKLPNVIDAIWRFFDALSSEQSAQEETTSGSDLHPFLLMGG